jgi:dihydroxyacid dehydratase/phosphogluconate dehydratase
VAASGETSERRLPAALCRACDAGRYGRRSGLHRGRAVVFENIEHYKERIDNPDLEVDENCILVLKNCGPKGYPGMAEVGNMSLPSKLLKRGITDMVRSDARLSGTAYGTVVLHVCPDFLTGCRGDEVPRESH